MLRSSIQKAAKVSRRCVHIGNTNKAAVAKPSAEQTLLEVYIDDKKVLVEPGTTVLQVMYFFCFFQKFYIIFFFVNKQD